LYSSVKRRRVEPMIFLPLVSNTHLVSTKAGTVHNEVRRSMLPRHETLRRNLEPTISPADRWIEAQRAVWLFVLC